MTDEEVNTLVDTSDTLYLIEYRKTDDSAKLNYIGSPNKEHIRKLAANMQSDTKYRKILLRQVSIERTWEPVATVEFQEKN